MGLKMPSDKDKKIEDAAIEYADKCVSSGHEYHRIMFLAYKSGAHFGYELAQEKITELEQQLQKAEKVIEFYGGVNGMWGNAECDELIRQGGFFPYDANDYDQVKDGGKLARQYLTNKGGKGE